MQNNNHESKRVAFLLPDLRCGGAEKMSVNLANEFIARGVEVDMLLMRKNGELLERLDTKVRVFELGVERPRNVLLPLIRHMRSNPVEGLRVSMWPLTILAVLARTISGAPCRVVAVEHTTWSGAPIAQFWRTRLAIKFTMRWLLPKANAVVAVSNSAAADLERFAGLRKESVITVYNPVARGGGTVHATLAERFRGWSSGPHKKVLAVGTLKEEKDFASLLKAFSLVRKRQNARLLILGEGPKRGELEYLIEELDLKGVVDLPGSVINTTPFYAHADLFVMASRNEGFGNVIVEALEQGTPVVSTDCPSGPREILDNGKYGTLVPVGDPDALAAAILESLIKPHDHEALRNRALDFSVDKAADAYLDLLLPGWRLGAHIRLASINLGNQ